MAYLARKIKERGWNGEEAADPEAIAERMAELRYVDDRAYAEAKAAAMERRGLGARRVAEALRHAGVSAADSEEVQAELRENAVEGALAFARRKRIGPFSSAEADRALLERQVAAMVRAGHAPSLARRIARMSPGEDPDSLLSQN